MKNNTVDINETFFLNKNTSHLDSSNNFNINSIEEYL